MLETIAAGLIVALVTGVTFVAYKHPQSYRQFFKPLWMIGVPAIHDVVNRAGILNSQLARHAGRMTAATSPVSIKN